MSNQSLKSIVGEHKTTVIIIAMALFLIELEIVAVFSARSGKQTSMQMVTQEGYVIYETKGSRLSNSDKHYFEKTFGPLENYTARLNSRQIPFPFRAWFVTATGIPIGAMLLFGFIFKACIVLFQGEIKQSDPSGSICPAEGTWLEKILVRFSRLNVFIIGFILFLLVLGYWVIPNLIVWLGHAGIAVLSTYKWVVLSIGGVATCIFIWIIYLRYLLAKKTIEQKIQVEKLRLQLELKSRGAVMPRLEYDPDGSAGAGDSTNGIMEIEQ
jgi:hypothetical protein